MGSVPSKSLLSTISSALLWAMTLPFIPDNAFPLPAPLTPKLVALGLDSKNAATISQAYLSVALTLRDKWETEYIKACNALVVASDNRGYSSKELRAKLLTVTVARCGQAISKWMEEVIQKAEASVLKRSRQCIPLHRVSLCNWLRGR